MRMEKMKKQQFYNLSVLRAREKNNLRPFRQECTTLLNASRCAKNVLGNAWRKSLRQVLKDEISRGRRNHHTKQFTAMAFEGRGLINNQWQLQNIYTETRNSYVLFRVWNFGVPWLCRRIWSTNIMFGWYLTFLLITVIVCFIMFLIWTM